MLVEPQIKTISIWLQIILLKGGKAGDRQLNKEAKTLK